MSVELPGLAAVTTGEIVAALRLQYALGDVSKWQGFPEIRVGAGYVRAGSDQRIDFLAVASYPSAANHERIAFEIKVSRGDFLREVKQPKKRRRALMLSNRFYFVTPAGLIRYEELPPECGLIEYRDGVLVVVHAAPWRDSGPPSWSFLVSAVRLAYRLGLEDGRQR